MKKALFQARYFLFSFIMLSLLWLHKLEAEFKQPMVAGHSNSPGSIFTNAPKPAVPVQYKALSAGNKKEHWIFTLTIHQ
ncbi:hypothetical protein C1N53_03000 [Pontibacter sp. SGAir0037]|nr:hypothetical protein C1N53_03000 [Pontibacter sp. SGAir0037]